ncbi:LOW QUALITY PROTEIN: autophagy-related protein 13a-like [Prosopis cineraria]|uniref:LOW QUALITY PROTEIN: autophagy-related protein 13a-like n=1 Tax=Prosopis cineraria TaxID=364024 RepID=UPI0024107E35|nr:LOW QUALITY PROTEIN: autophagy-related protein 13a-like [Prosopis cineraria]
MDLQNNLQPESGKLEQIVSQFLLKSLHVILDSRVPSLHPHDRSGELSLGSRVKKSDRWFNLALGDRPAALNNLNFWHRSLMDPMVIDIILVQERAGPSLAAGSPVETVIERWVVQYECPRVMAQTGDISGTYKKTYKKSIILFRALCSQMRLLPAYRIFRQLSTSSHNYNFDIIYKVSSFSDPFSRAEEKMMEEYKFTSVEAPPGCLCISVNYRTTLSDFKLEFSTPLPPKIITDYVGSPNTDPLRYFPASEKGVRSTSFPLRGLPPPSPVPLERPHSWTSGFHKGAPFAPNQPFVGSPPVYRLPSLPNDYPSPPLDNYGIKVHNHQMLARQRSTSHDECQLSPPFSHSLSPSPPNPMRTRMRSETAPVTIPLPVMGKSSRNLSPNLSDHSRNSLPPLSPEAKNDTSSQESPSGMRSFRKIEASRIGEMQSGFVKDNKDDSGRFSGLLSSSGSPRIGFSRSSSRLSLQDDLDDGDFSCPFLVDDVDTPDVNSSQNVAGMNASEITSTSLPIGRKSQDALVGDLVRILRNAPPLRQDPSCYSSVSLKTEFEEGVSTASGFFMPRKTADALEELKSYREMRDLLSRSGNRVMNKDES